MPQCFADTSGSLSWIPHFRPFPIIRSNAPTGNANAFKGPETATILGFILHEGFAQKILGGHRPPAIYFLCKALREILVDQESPGKLEIRVRVIAAPEEEGTERDVTSSAADVKP